MFTNFPNGITSFGVPVFGSSGAPVGLPGFDSNYGRTWWVDSYSGSDGNPGDGPNFPFLTMAKAFSLLQSGDVINFRGKITEQLVTPVNVFDVWINGLGNRPRHADSSPVGGNIAAAQWAAPTSGGTAAQATLRVLQQGWRFSNFLMTAIDANAACIEIVRNAGAGDAERDASHASMLGMRFSGAGIGVRGGVAGTFTEIPYNVEIAYSQFDNMTTAISSAIECNAWSIHDNRFFANTNNITMVIRAADITNNVIAGATTNNIVLTGATGGNRITKNFLGGTFSIAGGYSSAAAGDEWWGNFADVAGGVTQADPA